jgi:tyrosinase
MLSDMRTSFLLGFATLVSASLLTFRNASAPGRNLAENVTSQTFFNNNCTFENVSIRKEWRSLTYEEKMAFVNAELCLMSLPAKTGLLGAATRFDDFQAAHQQGTNTSDGDIIHYTV